MQPGKGSDWTSGTVQNCDSTGCIECSVDRLFCKACNTGLEYWLNRTTEKCVPVNQIVDYNGAKRDEGFIAPCNSTGCLLCKPDRMYCDECDSANNYWRENTYCFHYTLDPKIPIGRGVDRSGSKTVKHCTDTHCLNCFFDYTKCLTCDKAIKFYLNVTDCTEDVAMPSGWGGNLDTGVATLCQDTNCFKCNYDYRICFQCNVSSPQRYVYKPTDACASPPLENLGVSTTYYWETCTDATYCKYCAANVNYCTECYMAARSIAKFAYLGNCLVPAEMQPGKGSDWTSGTVQNCDSTGCIECSVDRLFCKACNTGLEYWLNRTTEKCVPVNQIVDYNGAKRDEGFIAPCNSTGCLLCKPDRMYCDECDSANNYWRENTYCFHYTLDPKIPIGRGIDRTPKTVKHCNDTHCLGCFDDYMICKVCDKANGWYLNLTYCRHVDDMPRGWGANIDTGVSALCQDTNCFKCNYDYRICFQCNVSSPQMYVYLDQCIYPSPDTYGVGTSYYWEKCIDQHCRRCEEDKTKCTVCYTAPGYQAFKDRCYLPEDLEEGTGSDWSTGTSIRCNSTGCLDCNFDYMTCKRCNVKQEFYLEGTWCKKWNTIAVYKGGDAISGRVAPCSDRGCIKCDRNNTHCTLCNQPERYYLDPPGWWCILYEDIPYGKGTHNESWTLKPCSQTSCSICFPDYQLCLACKTQSGFYLNESTSLCVSIKNMGKNYGPHLLKGTIEKCTSVVCIDCSLNYVECIECDLDLGYVIVNGVCTLNYDPTLFVRSAWDSGKKSATALFNFYPEYIPSFELVLEGITVLDTANGAIYTYKELNGEVTQTPLGFIMKFTTEIDILSGTIRIPMSDKFRILDKNARNVFSAYPIELPGVYLVKPTQTTESATESLDRAASTKSLITMAMVSFNPMVAVSLDFLFNELFVLRLYEGPFIAYPDLIMKSTSNASVLPIQVANWFESDIDENACVASEQFDVMGNGCLFLDNWGDDLSKMIVILGATFAVSLVYWILLGIYKWRGIKPGVFMKILEFANFNYGMQLFHTKMEGEKLELIVHMMLGMRHRKIATQYPINIVMMFVIQAYYWTIALMAVSFSAEVGRYLTRSPAVLLLLRKHNEEQKKLAETVGDYLKQMTQSMIVPNTEPQNQPTNSPRFALLGENQATIESPLHSRRSPQLSRGNTLNMSPVGRSMFRGDTLMMASQGQPTPANLSRGDTLIGRELESAKKVKKIRGIKNRKTTIIRPAGDDVEFDINDLERPAGREERAETPPSSERSHEIPQMDLGAILGLGQNPAGSSGSKVNFEVEDLEAEAADEFESEYEEYEEEEAQSEQNMADPTTIAKTPQLALFNIQPGQKGENLDANPIISIFGGLGEKQKEKKAMLKKKKKKPKFTKLKRFRPSTKDVMDLENNNMAQIAFVVAEVTIPKNRLYRFAIPASMFRATLLGIILTKVIGQPPVQIALGIAVESCYLAFLVKGDFKASRLEYWVENTVQFFQIMYLAFKLISTVGIFSDDAMQTVIGIPMVVSLGLFAGISILFILYSMVEIIIELVQLGIQKYRQM